MRWAGPGAAPDESDDEAHAAAGINPGPNDAVVLVTRFVSAVEDRIIH